MRRTSAPAAAMLSVFASFGLVLATNSPAFAADEWRSDWLGDDVYMNLIRDGHLRGSGYFRADPVGSAPGDSFHACDNYADGKGMEVSRKFNGSSTWKVMASTRGHSAGYCTPDITDNMAEGTYIAVRLCIVEGTHQTCGPEKWTTA